MNINDHVWVRLTEAGVRLWKKTWPLQHVHEDGRWVSLQLHELINLLGGSLHLWDPTPYIAYNEISIEKPRELGGFTPPKAPAANPILPTDGHLTRTEIFLRLVDSYCKQPEGLTHGRTWHDRADVMRHLRVEAERAFEFWGGK
jgi:hypothetical protein